MATYKILIVIFILVLFCHFSRADLAEISKEQNLTDYQQLFSESRLFKMQFFSPGKSRNRYLGIFARPSPDMYSDVIEGGDEKAVWIANRDDPLTDTSASLMIDRDGRLMISHSEGTVILLSATPTAATNLTAILLDNGNFVLRDLYFNGSGHRTLWQSFDYPTDTLLPGMKLGINLRTGHNWSLTSWATEQAPASGSFTFGLDPNGTNQLIILWMGKVYWKSGPLPNGHFGFKYVSNADEKYFMYTAHNSVYGRYTVSPSGSIQDGFERNKVFGNCIDGIPDAGCVKQVLPQCRTAKKYWFELRQVYMFGDSFKIEENYTLSLSDCKAKCENDCSCVAYASVDSNDGTGCQIWGNSSSFVTASNSLARGVFFLTRKDEKRKWWIWLTIAVPILVLVFAFSLCYLIQRKLIARGKAREVEKVLYELAGPNAIPGQYNDKKLRHDIQIFSLETIHVATNNFWSANKLGEGGYGPVYKGMLVDGQEVAIKRLSTSSGQGLVEFQNEIKLIAKLQHTNLVRLLGCCVEGEEKILVYEYMMNKSLDFFLFDASRRDTLKWNIRLNIIEGVAQGILYLHKYSRLRVIHRDLKASNILLDDNMNPKISDFGLARIFGKQEFEANTERIVGTYGYMSPEYAMNGIVSMKADVFSFGVLVLEILNGKRNNSCYHLERPLNLIGYVTGSSCKSSLLQKCKVWLCSVDPYGPALPRTPHIVGAYCLVHRIIHPPPA
ncbi:G-type lectin S-receptor-like serine/threonine-protein kinase CES101 isoform X2 [Nicotiana tabacum]|uniref:Receptor-like serine/threonine-protein kinase n=1 Tax=Nicotiana tabacum TaxID=4097 RepID=A0A1S3YCZ7_TOBAC|nr:PREDICTED: G-type lectin S-receptor-like serine/threonine-protein kinase CES101 isoform X2 [Nicotiana tabacum]